MMQILGVLGTPKILQKSLVPLGFAVEAHVNFGVVLGWRREGPGINGGPILGLAAGAGPAAFVL